LAFGNARCSSFEHRSTYRGYSRSYRALYSRLQAFLQGLVLAAV